MSGKFYRYDGRRYIHVPDSELAQDIRTYLRQNQQAQSNNIIGNVLPIVHNYVRRTDVENPPFYMDAGPWPRRVIAYDNGLLDVDAYLSGTVKVLEHTRQWFSLNCLPYDFDPEANCPSWLHFLDEVFEGDAERIGLLQEWFGYIILGDTAKHKLMIFYGPPRAGKGTTAQVLETLVGQENSTGFNLRSLANRFGLARLVGKLAAFVGEVNLEGCKDKAYIFETLNGIVGNDLVAVEEKYESQVVNLRLPVRFTISCNSLPTFVDPSGALAARLLLLPFRRSFAGKEDHGLGDKLGAEISGINNWALAGYRRLAEKGKFTTPATTEAIAHEAQRANSPALAFMEDCLLVERRLNPGNLGHVRLVDEALMVKAVALNEAYCEWCSANDRGEPNYNWLVRDLKDLLPGLEVKREMVAGVQERTYHGITLAPSC